MSVEVVQIDKLQLLAAALFTAAKYEEVFSPLVKIMHISLMVHILQKKWYKQKNTCLPFLTLI